jgi:RNA polymerase sigma factor (sigma-70 family)
MGMEGILETPAAATPQTRTTVRAELVAAARGGDRDAFAGLVEPELAKALGAARILLQSGSDAADAVQDALLSAWRGLDSLRDPEAFPAWFRRHVVRAAIRIGRRPHVVELDLSGAFAPEELERTVERRQLGRAFDRLEDNDRILLTLHHFWGLPIAETAGHLGIPEGTVKSRVHHAMTRLRAAYDAEDRR